MEEFLEVLTPDGAPTGVVKPKPDIHRDGDWHRSVHVWIVASDARLLLQRRALAKTTWPGLWDVSVAGHISAGETPVEAAIRETLEEIGLLIAADDLTHIGSLRDRFEPSAGYFENEFHEVYVVRRDLDLSALTLDPYEVAEVRYVRLDEMDRYERVPMGEEYELIRNAAALLAHSKSATLPPTRT